jgi:polyphosphate kinase 2 (PPK2 family)
MGTSAEQAGAIGQIQEAIRKVEPKSKSAYPRKQIQKIQEHLKKRDKEEIVGEALKFHYEAEELKPYQVELLKLQRHLETTGKKMVILFDGRDASGKGGTIRRITRYMNQKRYRVVALGKPTDDQKTELHIKRYIEHFPKAGEIVLFDRSWYNRALVEPVMGFCTEDQYRRFMKKVVSYEQNFLEDGGKTILLKLYFSVTKEEQKKRFERRKNDPLRQWKLSEVDLQAQSLLEPLPPGAGGDQSEQVRVCQEKAGGEPAPAFHGAHLQRVRTSGPSRWRARHPAQVGGARARLARTRGQRHLPTGHRHEPHGSS